MIAQYFYTTLAYKDASSGFCIMICGRARRSKIIKPDKQHHITSPFKIMFAQD